MPRPFLRGGIGAARAEEVPDMLYRVAVAFSVIVQASAVAAMDVRPIIVQQIHEPGICWEPDVEFPVPCDDGDDD